MIDRRNFVATGVAGLAQPALARSETTIDNLYHEAVVALVRASFQLPLDLDLGGAILAKAEQAKRRELPLDLDLGGAIL